MTINVDLSTDLQAWIRLAGMDLNQGSETADGRTVIWNKGGEVRYFIGILDGYCVMTSSDRMGAEMFHFATLTMKLLEKHLYGYFGGSVRKHHGFRRVKKPFARDELEEGYTLTEVTFAGREQDALMDRAGSMVAIGSDDRLVEFSHYIDVSVDAIKGSFLAPDGKPLFTLLAPG
ncbi:TNT antitoxin family protein [Mycobacterium sp.]|uniref:TNT antitoxin family protein n=1 Tax=Mycobacterium sp. TaxID=1785 RepID=UPI0025F7E34F|nr:TNT antitoxin family protein [Mycobacterium sp.]MBW0015291.1 TNT antitoxin family protein [Mycobacterium sp.]